MYRGSARTSQLRIRRYLGRTLSQQKGIVKNKIGFFPVRCADAGAHSFAFPRCGNKFACLAQAIRRNATVYGFPHKRRKQLVHLEQPRGV